MYSIETIFLCISTPPPLFFLPSLKEMPPVPGATPVLKEKKRRKQQHITQQINATESTTATMEKNGGKKQCSEAATSNTAAVPPPTPLKTKTTSGEEIHLTSDTVVISGRDVNTTNNGGAQSEGGINSEALLESTYGSMYTPMDMVGIDDLVLGGRKAAQVLQWHQPTKEHLLSKRNNTMRRPTSTTRGGRGVKGRSGSSSVVVGGEEAADVISPEQMFIHDPSRGLTNSSNACFLNATMQAIAHIPAFAQILVSCALEHQTSLITSTTSTTSDISAAQLNAKKKSSAATTRPAVANAHHQTRLSNVAPTCVALGQWIQKYYQLPPAGGTSMSLGGPLTAPSLPTITTKYKSMTGQTQEDASEFLQLLLETVQQELKAYEDLLLLTDHSATTSKKNNSPLAAFAQAQQGGSGGSKDNGGSSSSAAEGKGWVTVGKSKGDLFTIKTVRPKSIPPSYVMDTLVFGGMLHHQLKGGSTNRNKGITSVRAHPFFAIPVAVGGAVRQTIEEALKFTCMQETVENDERGTTMTKQEKMGVLPQTLIVQIKRWAMTAEGDIVKLDNVVTFGPTLVLPNDLTSHAGMPGVERTYILSSVVCHRGTGSSKGHYVTYLNNSPQAAVDAAEEAGKGYPMSLCDDFKVTASSLQHTWEDSPYFLFYRKMAPISSASSTSKKGSKRK